MAVVSLDSRSFGPALGRPGLLLIDWWARWCSPCRIFSPVFEGMAERYPGITFALVVSAIFVFFGLSLAWRTSTNEVAATNDLDRDGLFGKLSGVFHAVTGANGRFRTGQIMDVGAEGIDVYNTMLAAMGVRERLGPATRDFRAVDRIRA